jgi:hypothetical protein
MIWMGDILEKVNVTRVNERWLGYIFQEYIAEYAHWPWADMDLI